MSGRKWVRWTQWDAGGMVGVGQMPLDQVQGTLQKFELEARSLLERTGSDHVVYGMKNYDEDDNLEQVRFYLQPMSEEEFDRVAKLKGVQVYALHAMK